MTQIHQLPAELERLLREIAARHRRRQWLRGCVRFGLAMLPMVLALMAALEFGTRQDLPRGIPLTIFALGAIAAAWHWLYRPLTQKIPLRQIALYIDEHHPELENRIVSAVEFSSGREMNNSDFLIEQFLGEIRKVVPELSSAELIDSGSFARLNRTAILLWTAIFCLFMVTQQRWFPVIRGNETVVRARIRTAAFTVDPGNARVRRGANQVILVSSKEKGNISIRTRNADGEWQTAAMQPGTSDAVHFYQYLNMQLDAEYQVQVGGEASPLYRITVWTPPEVTALDQTQRYPEYLEIPPKQIGNSGEIAAVEGTKVDLNVQVNKALKSATLVLDSGKKIPLAEQTPAQWGAQLEVTKNDKYHIELLDKEGNASEYHPDYKIAALPDNPPKIQISFPRGDSEATPIEEVPITFKVSDDYSLADYGVQYAVAGKDPVRISLRDQNAATTATTSAKGTRLLSLETMGLQSGDFITWTAWAQDRKPGRAEFETTADPYFLEIRPFKREFTQAVSNMGGETPQNQESQEGGEGGQAGADEKKIIIATWNLRREGVKFDAREFKRRQDLIVKSQQTLMEKYREELTPGQNLQDVLKSPGRDIRLAMDGAVKSLQDAALPAPSQSLSQALLHEQEAYKLILRQKPANAQVMQSRQRQNQSQGQSQSQQEISELEMDRRKDFYEDANTQKKQEEQTAQSLDELSELAKRQKMLNEEMSKLLSEREAQKKEDEAENQRRLERLQEEQQRNMQKLDDIANRMQQANANPQQGEQRQSQQQNRQQTQQQLQDARGQMDRSMKNMQQNQLQQARAAANRALDSLNEAQAQTAQLSTAAAKQRLAELQKKMDELKKQQEEIVDQTQKLQADTGKPGMEKASASDKKVDDLLGQKAQLAQDVKKTLDDAGDLSDKAAKSQELMAQKLRDWARSTSGENIPQAIEQGKPLLKFGALGAAVAQENSVRDQLTEAEKKLADVSKFTAENDVEAMQKALEQLKGIMNEQNREQAKNQNQSRDQMTAQAGQPGAKQSQGKQGEQQGKSGQGKAGEQEQGVGSQPNEENGQGQGKGQGQRERTGEGEEQGQGQGEPQSQEQAGGKAAGNAQKGGGQGKGNGDRNGDGQNQDPQSQQQGDGPGEAQEPNQSDGRQQASATGQNGKQSGKAGNRGAPGSGQRRFGGAYGGGGPEDMRRFVSSDYRQWNEALRNAEALLPQDDPNRGELTRIRGEVDEMRKTYLRDKIVPKYESYIDLAVTPLSQVAEELQNEIDKKMGKKEFIRSDEIEVPAQYSDRVAEYFKSLSEQERAH